MLRCSVLGTVEARVPGSTEALDLGSPLQVQTLALLLAARGRRVSDDVLVDALWPDDPPPAARSSLRAYVSRLRSRLDPERRGVIVREADGYRLPPQVVALDASEAEASLESARDADPARRAELCEAALGSWRGTPYDAVPEAGGVGADRRRLEVLRDDLVRERLAALVDLGTPGVLTELHDAVEQNPFDEQLWQLLALALYRAGRQSDALDALRRARDVLAEELGLDPGPGLRRLEAAVLAQDPALEAPASAGAGAARALGRDRARRDDPAGEGPGVAAQRRSVPAPLTSFVGRAAQLDQLDEALGAHRLVTVVGIGGSGKTRLVLAAAARRTDDDGPWFVDLSGLHDATLLTQTLASALGLVSGGDAALVDALRDRRTLLVLDNCEHLLGPVAELVADLAQQCPGLRVLATSRVPLGVSGEHAVPLAPLVDSEAVELFVERAGAASGLPLAAADQEAAREICRLLDGLPLAVELAASQTRILDVAEVAATLRDRLDILDQADADRERRGRDASLRAVIGWSLERVAPADRDLLGSLSVFDGGFDLVAARAVGEGGAPVGVLLDLVGAGLLVAGRDAAGARRYQMLETVRALVRSDADPALLERAVSAHRTWLRELAAQAGAQLRGPDTASWLLRLEVEQPNARTALASALADGDGVSARSITADLSWAWFRRGNVAEGLRWCELALAAPRPVEWGGPPTHVGGAGEPGQDAAVAADADERSDAVATARTLMGAGLLLYLAGDMERLLEHGEQALAWAVHGDDAQTEAIDLGYLTYQHAMRGDLEKAIATTTRAELVARTRAPAWTLPEVLILRSHLQRAVGDHETALAGLADGLVSARATSHSWALSSCYWVAGKIALDRDQPAEAARLALRQVESQAREGDLSSWLVGLHLLAGALALSGRPEDGARILGAVDAHGSRVGFSPEAMDPADSPRHVEAVTSRVDEGRLVGLLAEGAALSEGEVMAFVAGLPVAGHDGITSTSTSTSDSPGVGSSA